MYLFYAFVIACSILSSRVHVMFETISTTRTHSKHPRCFCMCIQYEKITRASDNTTTIHSLICIVNILLICLLVRVCICHDTIRTKPTHRPFFCPRPWRDPVRRRRARCDVTTLPSSYELDICSQVQKNNKLELCSDQLGRARFCFSLYRSQLHSPTLSYTVLHIPFARSLQPERSEWTGCPCCEDGFLYCAPNTYVMARQETSSLFNSRPLVCLEGQRRVQV